MGGCSSKCKLGLGLKTPLVVDPTPDIQLIEAERVLSENRKEAARNLSAAINDASASLPVGNCSYCIYNRVADYYTNYCNGIDTGSHVLLVLPLGPKRCSCSL